MNKNYIKEKIKLIEEDYIRSIDRLNSDYNREQELMKQYRGRELLELLQNADDELNSDNPKEVKISFIGDVLSISNYGEPFSKEGFLSLLYPNNSQKLTRKKKVIGNKGTGFRSILGWADEIKIDSGDLHIVFSEEESQKHIQKLYKYKGLELGDHKAPTLAFPIWNENPESSLYTTTISIKVKNDNNISDDILRQISNINDEMILFLNNTDCLSLETEDSRIRFNKEFEDDCVKITKYVNEVSVKEERWIFNRVEDSIDDEWYTVVVAYRESGRAPENQVVYSYFPTEITLPYPLLLHANFILGPNRNQLIKKSGSDKANEVILKKAAELIVRTAKDIYRDEVSYKILEFLLIHEEFHKDFQSYNFEDMIVEAIRVYIPLEQHDRPGGTACHSALNCT